MKSKAGKTTKFSKVSSRLTQSTVARSMKSKRGEDMQKSKAWKTDMQKREAQKDEEELNFWNQQKLIHNSESTPASSKSKSAMKSNRKSRKAREEKKIHDLASPMSQGRSTISNNSIRKVIKDAVQATGVEDDEEYEYEYVYVSDKPQHRRKGYTIGGKPKAKKSEEAPGPGNYEYRSKAVEGPEYTIKKKYLNKYESTPGPGDYEKPEDTKGG